MYSKNQASNTSTRAPAPLNLKVVLTWPSHTQNVKLHVDAHLSMQHFKALVEKYHNFRVKRVYQAGKGALQDDWRTLQEYNVLDHSVLYVWGSPVPDCNCQGECACGQGNGCGCRHSVRSFR